MRTLLLSGAICGIAGLLLVAGTDHTITTTLAGGLYILYLYIPSGMNLATKELYKLLPYLVTIAVLIISSLRKKRENDPPANLGLAYFREER